MSATQDAELTRELEALVAAKEQEQLRAKLWFASALALLIGAVLFHRHSWPAFTSVAASIGTLALGVRHHLRASALRNQAMEKILAEAFRHESKAPPKEGE